MDIGIPVEAEGSHGEFYPGIICDVISAAEYRVQLLDSSRNTQVVELQLPPSSMRPLPDIANFSFEPVQGQEVDVLLPFSPSDIIPENDNSTPVNRLSAWWPGRVKKIGGGFVIVDLLSSFTTDSGLLTSDVIEVVNGRVNIPLPPTIAQTDIVEKHQLRPRSQQPNFTTGCFHMHAIHIPDELETYCRDPVHYQHFARRCGLPVLVCLAPDGLRSSPTQGQPGETYEKKACLLVISTNISTVKRAAVIDNTFIDMLRHKVQILQQNEELSRKLEASRVTQFAEDVFVPENLIPHAIGYQGSNIRRASSIKDVLSINLDRHNCVFRITGKTEEAVRKAKALMDYTTQIVPVPRQYVGPIVGSGQRHIQHIVDCLGLVGLKICHVPESDQSCESVAFQLTGTSQAIRDAHMFLNFHIDSLQDLDRLRGVDPPQTLSSHKQSVDETEGGLSSGDGGGTRQGRHKPARSSQRGRHGLLPSTVQCEPVNGCIEATDPKEAHLHENGELHSPPSSDSGFQQPIKGRGSRLQPGQRQRPTQSNNSNQHTTKTHGGANRPMRDRELQPKSQVDEKRDNTSNHVINGNGPGPRNRQQDRRRVVRPTTSDAANAVPVVH